MCSHLETLQAPGRRRKSSVKSGRPCGFPPTAAVTFMRSIAPPSTLNKPASVPWDSAAGLCVLCHGVLDRPLELTCGKMACVECLCRCVQDTAKAECPCCSNHQLDEENVRTPSAAFLDILNSLRLYIHTNVQAQCTHACTHTYMYIHVHIIN